MDLETMRNAVGLAALGGLVVFAVTAIMWFSSWNRFEPRERTVKAGQLLGAVAVTGVIAVIATAAVPQFLSAGAAAGLYAMHLCIGLLIFALAVRASRRAVTQVRNVR